jgi:hypothetical protein
MKNKTDMTAKNLPPVRPERVLPLEYLEFNGQDLT